MTKFFNSHIVPPRGGWIFPVGGQLVEGYSESEVIEALIRWQKNNGAFVSYAAAEELVWEYYCAREPARCGRPGVAPSDQPIPGALIVAEKTPRVQGPPIWLFLNTVAAQWNPSLHQYFLATVDAISSILDCPDCRKEWRELVALYPPADLASRFDVCRWVNKVHNAVNAKTGKMNYSYEKMVSEFGAPIS